MASSMEGARQMGMSMIVMRGGGAHPTFPCLSFEEQFIVTIVWYCTGGATVVLQVLIGVRGQGSNGKEFLSYR